MKKLFIAAWAGLIAASLGLDAAAREAPRTPHGWTMSGDRPDDFTVRLDRKIVHGGPASAHLTGESEGFGALMQTISAEAYVGQRVRLSGQVRTELGDDQWGALWMRIDGPQHGGGYLGFDNMQDRPIRGRRDWRRYEVVLDVPETATAIAFGALLLKGGDIWIDDLAFEVVGDEVPVTQPSRSRAPRNLDFEEGRP